MRAQQLVAIAAALVWLSSGCDQESSRVAQAQQEPDDPMDQMGEKADEMREKAGEMMPGQEEMPSMRELDEGPSEHVVLRPSEIEWQPGPASFEEGAQVAMLEGDLAEEGVFTARFRLPDGFVINPHQHPNVERLTVMRGTLHLGMGEELDRASAEPLPAGSYGSMPKETVHYVIAEGDTVIQLSSVGPWEIDYVNPAHDPRRREMPVSGR